MVIERETERNETHRVAISRSRLVGGGLLLAVLGAAGQAVSQSCCIPGGPYGDGSLGDLTVASGEEFVISDDASYANVTVEEDGRLIIVGSTLRVCGTLTNYGEITDNLSGGTGGSGGAGGLGADPWENDPSGFCGDRGEFCEHGYIGSPGQPGAVAGSGTGGAGGCGGGGGGGAWHALSEADADGGNGGTGGFGGKGGGAFRIFTLHLDNHGVIHADGQPGSPGWAAPDGYESCGAEYYVWGMIKKDLAGGGGGGGGGGNGGNGGTVEVYYAYPENMGEIHALGGLGGIGGEGGPIAGSCKYGVASGGHDSGCVDGLAHEDWGYGGRGAHQKGDSPKPGKKGSPGEAGAPGSKIVELLYDDCNDNGMLDTCDIADGTSADVNLNGVPDECEWVSEYCLDQQCLPDEEYEVREIASSMPIGQGFVPSQQKHAALELALEATTEPSSPAPVTVRIRQETIDGPIVPGSTVEQVIEEDGWAAFFFGDPVSLDSGQSYVIEVVAETPDWGWSYNSGDFYPYGDAFVSGAPTLSDQCFRTWAVCIECPADLNGDGTVDVVDLLLLISQWGECPPEGPCLGDLDESGVVDVLDILSLLGAWGPCE